VFLRLVLFGTPNGFLPGGSSTKRIQHTSAKVKYTIQISQKITLLKINKQNKEEQMSSRSYTNSEGHITANEYSVEEENEKKPFLIQALEAY
jgi:predicted restriction endonuclease